MALLTAQQISRYFDSFHDVDVVFTKEVIATVGLQTKNIFLKHVGDQIPCVVYSVSMTGAKIVANVRSETFVRIRGGNSLVSLRFAFQQPDRPLPLAFYVNSKIVGYSPYGKENQGLNFISLAYPQRPPDDLIAVLGQLLETSMNSKKRHEERITITADNVQKLGLKSKDTVIYIDGVQRKCIIRDLSFSGARVIVPGTEELLKEKPVALSLELDEKGAIQLLGKIIRIETVADREDIAAIAILFAEQSVPLGYKMRINDYLSSGRHVSLGKTQTAKATGKE
jgi:PilZN3 domain/PilZ domain